MLEVILLTFNKSKKSIKRFWLTHKVSGKNFQRNSNYRTPCHAIGHFAFWCASGHLVVYCKCCRFERAFFILRLFLPYTPSCCFQASLGASSSISKLAGLHTDLQNSPTPTIHLSHNNPQKKYSGRFCLRVMASQLHNEESAPCGIRTLFTIVEMLKAIWFICLTTVFMIWLKNYSCPSVFNKKMWILLMF